jgi:hypothetical protein
MQNIFMSLLFTATIHSLVVAQERLTMVKDPSGKTQYLVPQDWKVDASQEGNNYFWTARESDTPGAPTLVAVIVPDENGSLENKLLAVLNKTIKDIKIQQVQKPTSLEYHILFVGVINGIPAHGAAFIVRDPGKFLFINLMAGRPSRYDKIQGDFVLYEALHRQNPFDYSAMYGKREYLYDFEKDKVDNNYNMQSTELQKYIVEKSVPLQVGQLYGKWMQVMGYSTGKAYEHIISGEIQYGERGFGHILDLNANGSYTLTYLYNMAQGGCQNSAQFTETGIYSLAANKLTLSKRSYHGTFNLCGSKTYEAKNSAPSLQFEIGLLPDGEHMAIYGKPFEYEISTDMDETGKIIRLGFYKVKN